ncbi:hypothetical protein EV646_105409 [Kribbella antiqua]|uniref:Uncharacterized protein n=1 Tax=Kribbella antiqua TaxID=2512217 RepID=A0A4R2IR60_9ACTN|nr:hypothetical protein [Kribbella antiqua]TCO47851.1 hypothetical protein EV646_105409 [Kribbella antiqua]
MASELVGEIAVAVGGVLSAAVPLLGNRANRKTLRDDMDRDIAAMNALPEGHPAREAFGELIKRQAEMMTRELETRRDPFGIGLGVGFIVTGMVVGIVILRGDLSKWWLIAVALAFLIGSAALAQDASKLKRDPKGKPIHD